MTEFLVGGYTADMGGEAQGIGRARSHPDGRFEFLGVAAEVESPTWLVLDGGLVHAALEGADEVASFARTDDGLALIGRVAAGGDSPCHLAVAPDALLAACYEDGAVGGDRPRRAPCRVAVASGAGRRGFGSVALPTRTARAHCPSARRRSGTERRPRSRPPARPPLDRRSARSDRLGGTPGGHRPARPDRASGRGARTARGAELRTAPARAGGGRLRGRTDPRAPRRDARAPTTPPPSRSRRMAVTSMPASVART